jgi:hypothetical protein
MEPGEQQRWASETLPEIVSASHLQWWKGSRTTPPVTTRVLLLVVAPWSHYDLAMLDLLDESFSRSESLAGWRGDDICVANLLSYGSFEQLAIGIPGINQRPSQTPVVAKWEYGGFEWSFGKPGRDLVAKTIGLSSNEFNRTVVARVPKASVAG